MQQLHTPDHPCAMMSLSHLTPQVIHTAMTMMCEVGEEKRSTGEDVEEEFLRREASITLPGTDLTLQIFNAFRHGLQGLWTQD